MNIALMQDSWSLLSGKQTHVTLESVITRIKRDLGASLEGERLITLGIIHEMALHYYHKHLEDITDKIGDEDAVYNDAQRNTIYSILMESTKKFNDVAETLSMYAFSGIPRRVKWYEDMNGEIFEIVDIDFTFSPLLASGEESLISFRYSKYQYNEELKVYEFINKDEWKNSVVNDNGVPAYVESVEDVYKSALKKNIAEINKKK